MKEWQYIVKNKMIKKLTKKQIDTLREDYGWDLHGTLEENKQILTNILEQPEIDNVIIETKELLKDHIKEITNK